MTYPELVLILRSGRRLPEQTIRAVLAAAGTDFERLALDVLAGSGERLGPGDTCPACGEGQLRVVRSRRAGVVVVRSLRCRECPFHTRQTVSAGSIWTRKKRAMVAHDQRKRSGQPASSRQN